MSTYAPNPRPTIPHGLTNCHHPFYFAFLLSPLSFNTFPPPSFYFYTLRLLPYYFHFPSSFRLGNFFSLNNYSSFTPLKFKILQL
ncbi:hypothetical protein HanIR_Chr09g0418051 [Helianthus annuus]|nr:hypothetical protein HanIR_Chr09g0418051 [Helianthus annuus]